MVALVTMLLTLVALVIPTAALAAAGGEASLVLPDLGSVDFLGMSGQTLLTFGLIVCVVGSVIGWEPEHIRPSPRLSACSRTSSMVPARSASASPTVCVNPVMTSMHASSTPYTAFG